jgi:hypothetical protein
MKSESFIINETNVIDRVKSTQNHHAAFQRHVNLVPTID